MIGTNIYKSNETTYHKFQDNELQLYYKLGWYIKYFTAEIFHTVEYCYVEAIKINLKILLMAFNCISGLMVSVFTLSVIDRGFESQSSQTIDIQWNLIKPDPE